MGLGKRSHNQATRFARLRGPEFVGDKIAFHEFPLIRYRLRKIASARS